MGHFCCTPKIGSIYPIEEALLNAMNSYKIRKYNIDEYKERLKKIFDKQNIHSNQIDLRDLFLDNHFDSNPHYVLQNTIFDLFLANLEKFTHRDVLILSYPLLNNAEEKDKLNFTEILSHYFSGEFTFKNLEYVLKRIIMFYTRKINSILAKKMEEKKDVNCIEDMNSKLFSESKINEFLSNKMEKVKHFQDNTWGNNVTTDECILIIKRCKIWDFEEIRNNFLLE